MLVLYDNPFSPFARKVRMVLRYKGLPFRSIDALAKGEHGRLVEANPRAEVPVLVDGALSVADSADIVAYLEDRFPTPAVFPTTPELRATARRWQRIADSALDAIVHDVSIWIWPTHHRSDQPPAGKSSDRSGLLASYAASCRSPTLRCFRTSPHSSHSGFS
jgi:glutathione S-transferase